MDVPKKLKAAAEPFKLTRRQLQTLTLSILGEPWKSIGTTLGISIRTVRFHAENICRKMRIETLRKAPKKLKIVNF